MRQRLLPYLMHNEFPIWRRIRLVHALAALLVFFAPLGVKSIFPQWVQRHDSGVFIAAVFLSALTFAVGDFRLARLRRRVRAAGMLVCPGCGYDLRGLGDRGACPECGRGFDAGALRAEWPRCPEWGRP